MQNNRPHIIVTGPNRRIKFAWWATRIQLWLAKATATYVCPGNSELPSDYDGVVIGGGNDIDPKHYGLTGTAGANYDAARDTLELKVIHAALEKQVPILGICRGEQLINVACGGNLVGDLRPLRVKTPNRNSILPVKSAIIERDSRLARVLGQQKVPINSLHNQAVDKVGDGLQAAAHDADGFVQAIEGTRSNHWLIGVQWHPEYLLFKKVQRKIFAALRDAAQKNAQRKQTD